MTEQTGPDLITLSGLRARGFHGVLPSERELGQEFVLDLVLHVDTRAAAAGDELTATVNYADVAGAAVEVLTGPPVDLIETVAERIAERVLRFAGVQAVDVVVHKPAAPIPHPFDDVAVRIHRTALASAARTTAPDSAGSPGLSVVVALGANEGDGRTTLEAVLAQLSRHPRVDVSAVSPLVRSRAHVLPGAPAQADYLNAVALLRTTLPVRELLALCQGIELGHGRVRRERWAARPLDIDIIAAGDQTWQDQDLTLPHPRAHQRSFVLAPWSRIAPDAQLPGHGRVAELAANLGEDGLEWLAHWTEQGWTDDGDHSVDDREAGG